FAFPCSGRSLYRKYPPNGKPYDPILKAGIFAYLSKKENYWSNLWQCPMDWSTFWEAGLAVHATTNKHFHMLGKPDSGGCIRLLPRNAYTHYYWIDDLGNSQIALAHNPEELNKISPHAYYLFSKI
ncbi:MAG: hypothetical protein CEN91_389, partial [Candidatus Berkelbacteria bacterium Licking1014_85]